jgi:low affinity Fe/Cu permease
MNAALVSSVMWQDCATMGQPENGIGLRDKVAGHHDAPLAEEPSELFRHFAHWTAEIAGSVWTFAAAVVLILVWVATGPIFHFSDTWQLVINTATTIVTFLMVFLIQNTQNRDARAIHLKLDELIRVSKARNLFMNLEELSDKELADLTENLAAMRERSAQKLATRAEARKCESVDQS